jgi:hypothetical protein
LRRLHDAADAFHVHRDEDFSGTRLRVDHQRKDDKKCEEAIHHQPFGIAPFGVR